MQPLWVLGNVDKGHDQAGQIRLHKHAVSGLGFVRRRRHADKSKRQQTAKKCSCFHDASPFLLGLQWCGLFFVNVTGCKEKTASTDPAFLTSPYGLSPRLSVDIG
jgi:hypothetical protein